jgi:eukaryotic-like serine/threonine-protein kinase
MKPTDGSFDPTLTPEQVAESTDTALSVIAPSSPGPMPRPSLREYRIGEVLGRGGMGEVLLAEDLRIGREVAIKRMRFASPSDDALARFLREAKIQARLDHPAIVPVHELGQDADGRPYFTMKRLTKTTLLEVMEAKSATQTKLLRAFVDVCLAIDFAHSRGFIHRDLKPANVVLGNYGEVYVLDWGLARAVGEPDEPRVTGVESLGGDTQVGTVMGTPGYMSPEQLRGEPVGLATDIYALGAILYEILAGRAVHPRGKPAVAATLAGGTLSPNKDAPERNIAPELDQLCTEALAEVPAGRPTARELADRVQQFLDGDRDTERRCALAAELVVAARADLESGDPERRAHAMRSAGRALALDPTSEPAAALVGKLMLEPPKVMPPALVNTLAKSELDQASMQAKLAVRTQLSYFAFAPVLLWMGVREWSVFFAIVVLVPAAIGAAYIFVRRPAFRASLAMLINVLLLIILCRLTSPVLIMPGMFAFAATSFAIFPTLIDRWWISILTFSGALALVFGLEATGVWASSWEVSDGRFIAHPPAISIDGTAGTTFMIASAFAIVIVVPMFVRSLALALRKSRQQLEVQAWHLAQLIPETRLARADAPA